MVLIIRSCRLKLERLRLLQILIVYHSRTGHTRKMALAVAEGARAVRGVSVVLKKIDETTNDDLLKADSIIVGSPTYFGQMSGKVKALFDRSNEIHGKLEDKVELRSLAQAGMQAVLRQLWSRFWKRCSYTG